MHSVVLVSLFLYYFAFKYFLKKIMPRFCLFGSLKKKFPKNEYFGAFEMVLLSLSHLLFCLVIVMFFKNNGFNLYNVDIKSMLYSVILGVSLFGLSNFLCQLYVFLVKAFNVINAPSDKVSWFALSKSGWIKHHFQCVKVFPALIYVPVIFLQVACEEFVFRGFLINYFVGYGKAISVFISMLFFIFAQLFSMPSIFAAAFPVIGALVMGLFHSYLFLKTHQIIPLMISHFCFFIFVIFTMEAE